MAQLIFEKFGFGHALFETQALLSLMAEGHNTGLVLDSGDGVTHVIPVVDGQVNEVAVREGRLNLAGHRVTDYLVRLLGNRGYAFNSTADFEVVREIKEQCCFVSYDREKDMKLAKETTLHDQNFTLPDGKTIRIGAERFLCAEALFNPGLIGVDDGGYHNKIFDVIEKCEIDNRTQLMQNIILTGGTTMFPGLSTRLYKDLHELYTVRKYKNPKQTTKTGLMIHDPPRRKHNVFIGASFLAARIPEQQWISKAHYQEVGESALWQN
jgi:actin-related protein 2